MDFNKEKFKRLFPNLAKELESEDGKVSINSVRSETQNGEKAASSRFVNYMPDVIDFLRRCDTNEQAEEIIAYLEGRGELGKQYAEKLRQQLKAKGVRSFGPKKEADYYLKYGLCETTT